MCWGSAASTLTTKTNNTLVNHGIRYAAWSLSLCSKLAYRTCRSLILKRYAGAAKCHPPPPPPPLLIIFPRTRNKIMLHPQQQFWRKKGKKERKKERKKEKSRKQFIRTKQKQTRQTDRNNERKQCFLKTKK